MKLKHSVFIDIEGLDGTGKTTSIMLLKHLLATNNIPAIFTKEPKFKQSHRSQIIHSLLTDPNLSLSKNLQTALFIIARKLHIQKVIKPAMQKNRLIITDRYVMSSLAYQEHYIEGIGENHVMDKNEANIKDFTHYLPNLNFYFYMNPKNEIERLLGRPGKEDKFDKYLEHVNTLKQLQKNYKLGIRELGKYHSPTQPINADKNNQFQRAEIMFKQIKKMID